MSKEWTLDDFDVESWSALVAGASERYRRTKCPRWPDDCSTCERFISDVLTAGFGLDPKDTYRFLLAAEDASWAAERV